MSTGSVTVRLNLATGGYSSEMAKAERQMKSFAASTTTMGQHTVSSMQAASASIRLLEGGMTNNIRAAERFISLLPAISGLLEAAFPVVGAAALAGVFIRIGAEVGKYIQKLNEVPQNPFAGMIASAKVANDAIAVTNDRLEMEIEKLEHKPVNGMALALDEARQASDKLFESLEKSNNAFTEAMGKMNVSRMQGLWQNATPTAQADQNIAKARAGVQQVLADHQPTIDDALASGNQDNVKQAREALMVDLQKAYAAQDKALRDGLAAAQKSQADYKGSYSVGSDSSVVMQKYSGALQQSAVEQASAGGQYGESMLKPKKDQLEASNAAQEAERKRQEAIVQLWQKALDQDKANNDITVAQEAAYWLYRAETARKGSLSYIDAIDEANKKIAEINANTMEEQKKGLLVSREFDALSGGSAADHPDDTAAQARQRAEASQYLLGSGNQVNTSALQQQGKGAADYLKNLNESIALQHANADAIAEASLKMAVMTGQMSKLDAAQAEAALHAQEYKDAIEAIDQAIANAQNLPEGFGKQSTIAGLGNQKSQATASYQIQSAQDQQNVASQQIFPAAKQALDEMVQSFTDLAATLKNVIPQTIAGLNNDLTKLATGQYKSGDVGKTLTQAGQGLFKTGLQGIEGNVLKAFNLGKTKAKAPDGSPGSPFYVIPAGQAALSQSQSPSASAGGNAQSGARSIVGNLMHSVMPAASSLGFLGPSMLSQYSSAAPQTPYNFGSNPLASLAGDAAKFVVPFLADGGDILANRPAIIGENGPELFTPRSAGTVTPNSALGGGGDTHFHIDARGSSDPAAVHAAVMRAAPHIVAASMQAHHSSDKRKPSGR
jgi:hypothetical protein